MGALETAARALITKYDADQHGDIRGIDEQVEALRAALTVHEWNEANPIGSPVRYWPGMREGEGREGHTRTAATVVGGRSDHEAVVWIEGFPGFVALTHVEPIGVPIDRPRPFRLTGTHYATGDSLDVPLCGADDLGMFSCGEDLVTCPECRKLKGWGAIA